MSALGRAVRPYLALLRMRIVRETQYRAAAIAGIGTQFFFGLVHILMISAMTGAGQSGPTMAQNATYVWLQQAFLQLAFGGDGEVGDLIVKGNIAYELCRPISLYGHLYMRTLGRKLMAAGMRSIPIFLFATLLPLGMRMELPASIPAFAAFLVSILAGGALVSAVEMLNWTIVLKTLDRRGAASVMSLLTIFLSGNIVPLTLFPDAWQPVIRAQPFAQILDAPIRLYTGATPLSDFPLTLAVQLAWLVALAALGQWAWHAGLKRLVLQGG